MATPDPVEIITTPEVQARYAKQIGVPPLPPRRRDIAAQLLKDVAKLRQPREDALIFALALQILSPFGLNVGPWGARITAALLAVGLAASYLEKLREIQ